MISAAGTKKRNIMSKRVKEKNEHENPAKEKMAAKGNKIIYSEIGTVEFIYDDENTDAFAEFLKAVYAEYLEKSNITVEEQVSVDEKKDA